jgi:hypothetical protein
MHELTKGKETREKDLSAVLHRDTFCNNHQGSESRLSRNYYNH